MTIKELERRIKILEREVKRIKESREFERIFGK